MNPEESVLYIAVTRGNCIWRGPLPKDGSLTKVGVFYQLYGPGGPGGLAMDVDGNLAVVHAHSGNVLLFNKKGAPILRVETCAGDIATNLACGAADRRDLYITESETGTVMRARMPVAGEQRAREPVDSVWNVEKLRNVKALRRLLIARPRIRPAAPFIATALGGGWRLR